MARREEIKKLYYKIGEVCKITRLTPHTIYVWERSFDVLAFKRDRDANRLFTQQDIDNLMLIKYLLKTELYTIPGAVRQIQRGRKIGTKDHG